MIMIWGMSYMIMLKYKYKFNINFLFFNSILIYNNIKIYVYYLIPII